MRILYYNEGEDPAEWLGELKTALPDAEIRLWHEGDNAPAEYALVWNPPKSLFRGRTGLKAIFNLAAGVDSLLAMRDALPPGIPVFRLEDAGMAIQMAEYVAHAVLRYFRRFDEYEKQAQNRIWNMLEPYKREDFKVGIMGLGVMGKAVADALKPFGFPLRGWSRHKKNLPGIACYAGKEQMSTFLNKLRVLVCVLPLTAETYGILNRDCFQRLQHGAYLINVGRGAHLVENDLLEAMQAGYIRAATLDVTDQEPLPTDHPFWNNQTITLTPHIAALTFCHETVEQVADFIRAFEQGNMPTRPVNPVAGY